MDAGEKYLLQKGHRKGEHADEAESESDMEAEVEIDEPKDKAPTAKDKANDSGNASSAPSPSRRSSGIGIFNTLTSLLSRGRSHLFSDNKRNAGLGSSKAESKDPTPMKCCKEDFTMLRVIGKGSLE